jgi:hypothetical protein
MAGLARLTPGQRAEQHRLRWALFEYIDGLWDHAKAQGLSPADLPEYSAVAGLRDLADALVGHVAIAQENAGDDPDED